MDSYAVKFQSMQHYVPFLNKMICKLEKAADRDKEPQLVKMKSLHGILTDSSKKVRFETLLKCEEVLQKLYEKVEGGAGPVSAVEVDRRRDSSGGGTWQERDRLAHPPARPPLAARDLESRRSGREGENGGRSAEGFPSASSLRDTAILVLPLPHPFNCARNYLTMAQDPAFQKVTNSKIRSCMFE
jgi:hypothetical protein